MIGNWRTGNWKKRWRGVCCHICGQTEHEITLTPLHQPPSDDWWKPWSFIRADLHCHLCTFLQRPDLSQIDTRLWFTGSPPPSHPWLHPGFCQPFKDISCSFGSLFYIAFSALKADNISIFIGLRTCSDKDIQFWGKMKKEWKQWIYLIFTIRAWLLNVAAIFSCDCNKVF